jgi:hypothetical protein
MLIYSIDGNKITSHYYSVENENYYLITDYERDTEIIVPKENYYKTKQEAFEAASMNLLLVDLLTKTIELDSEIDESLLDHRKFSN